MSKGSFDVLRSKYFAYGFSLLILVLGVVFAIIFGGFNTGIDFGSGFSERIQIAPLGLAMSYDEESSVYATVSGSVLNLEFRDASGVHDYSFPSTRCETVGDLAKALESLGIKCRVADASLSVRNFAPGFGFPTTVATTPVRLNYSTDTRDVNIDDIRASLTSLGEVNVQTLGKVAEGGFQVKINVKDGETQREVENKVNSALYNYFGEENVVIMQSDFVGPKFSADLLKSSVWAILLAIVLILIYISFRFRLAYALSAIIALTHDVAAMLAFILIFRLEVSATTIAAVLTIIGYSLNNTIVIFDRVRENVKGGARFGVASAINKSVRQSLSRTVITSLTTLFAILPLAIFSSGDIKNFAINLTWGILIGTYSSNFLAPAFLNFFNRFSPIDREEEKENSDLLMQG